MFFINNKLHKGDEATVPPRIAAQRSMAFGSIFALCIGAAFFLMVYYLPVYFQAIKNVSALQSGINVLPLILSQVVGTILAGALTSKLGYYMPFVILSTIFMSIGAGIITLFKVDTPSKTWIGYQIVFGLGAGFGFQQITLAAQTVLDLKDVPTGTAMVMFVQLLGGALFVSVGENVFTNHLIANIISARVPGLDPQVIVATGVTELRKLVQPEFLGIVLEAYNEALLKTFQVALIMGCLTLLGVVGMEWKSVRGKELGTAVA